LTRAYSQSIARNNTVNNNSFIAGTLGSALETGSEQAGKSFARVTVVTGQARNGAYVVESRNAVSLVNKAAYVNATRTAKVLKYGGRTVGVGVIAYQGIDLAVNGGTDRDYAKLGVQSVITLIGFMGPVGFVISVGLQVADMNGAFDSFYDNFDDSEVQKVNVGPDKD
jgi:hypothetical protein